LPAVAGLPRSHRRPPAWPGRPGKPWPASPRGKVLEGLIGYILMRKS